MTFPIVLSTNAYIGPATNALTWGTFGTTVANVGDLLLFVLAVDGEDSVITASSGWSIAYQAQDYWGDVYAAVIWKIATSTTESLTITSSEAEQFNGILYRISGAVSVIANSFSNSVDDSNPPNLDAGAVRDHLWIAVDVSDKVSPAIAAPTNYTNFVASAGQAGSGGVSISGAYRLLNASSEDPDPFSRGTDGEEIMSLTIAVLPFEATPPPQRRHAARFTTAYF